MGEMSWRREGAFSLFLEDSPSAPHPFYVSSPPPEEGGLGWATSLRASCYCPQPSLPFSIPSPASPKTLLMTLAMTWPLLRGGCKGQEEREGFFPLPAKGRPWRGR